MCSNIHGKAVTLAEEIGADLMVLASCYPAMKDYPISVGASRVAQHASCPVLAVGK
jgi:hypothetical protein